MRRRRVIVLAVLVAGLWGAAEAAVPAEVGDPSPAPSSPEPACPAEQTGPAEVDPGAGGTLVWFVLVPPGCEVTDSGA